MTSTGGSVLLPAVPSVRRKFRIFRGSFLSRMAKSVGSNPEIGLPDLSVTSTSRLMRLCTLAEAVTTGVETPRSACAAVLAGVPCCPFANNAANVHSPK
jgi:hypothetical protein